VGEGWTRSSALTEVNGNILLHVQDADDGDLEWEFFCECGHDRCHEHVFLTLDAYITLRDGGGAALAEGHHLSQVERARRLRDDAKGLRAQAKHQVARAKKNTT
jgi:hypothetical protein